MSGDPKAKLAEAPEDARQVYLRDGRTLTVSETGADQLVEIRAASGVLELRIQLTEAGPVLQMESVKLQLHATEAVEIASKRIELKASGEIAVASETEVKVDAKGDVRINGAMIYLN
jgi:hypothetical protein